MFLYILATNNPKNENLNIFHERTKEDKILGIHLAKECNICSMKTTKHFLEKLNHI